MKVLSEVKTCLRAASDWGICRKHRWTWKTFFIRGLWPRSEFSCVWRGPTNQPTNVWLRYKMSRVVVCIIMLSQVIPWIPWWRCWVCPAQWDRPLWTHWPPADTGCSRLLPCESTLHRKHRHKVKRYVLMWAVKDLSVWLGGWWTAMTTWIFAK